MKEKVVFGGYDGSDLLKIAEAVVEDAHVQDNVMEFRRICDYVLELTEECVPPNELPDDVRCH